MNNIKYFVKNAICAAAFIAMGVAATSCDDLLDTKPQGVFTDEQIGDDEAVDLMTSAYATLLNHYFGNNESFAGPINNWVFDVRSDDALKGGDGVTMEGYMHQLEVGNVQSDNDIANFKWRNNYFSISRCNTAIKGILASSSISDADKASFAAEMKTLRAFSRNSLISTKLLPTRANVALISIPAMKSPDLSRRISATAMRHSPRSSHR